MKAFTAIALQDFPYVKSEDNIAAMIVEAAGKNGVKIDDGDVIVVAQKIISKAENRILQLKDAVPSQRAKEIAKTTGKSPKFVELVLKETKSVIKASREVLLVEDKRGFVCINAGIDKSNVDTEGSLALLPENPDASAEKCRVKIEELTGKKVGVIVCDTYSRPFRRGQVNFAIGMAGMRLFRDYRGKKDLFGHVLKVKNVAVIDEIAAAAELLMGQAKEATPVVIFKGLKEVVEFRERCRMNELFISKDEDLFKDTL